MVLRSKIPASSWMDDPIKFDEEVSKRIADGELVPFVVVLFRPADDELLLYRLWAITDEEAWAMLGKHGLARYLPPR